MSRTLQTRLDRLEAQQPAVLPDATTTYVHPLSPPSEQWWVELAALLDASPYRDVIMAALAGEEEHSACR